MSKYAEFGTSMSDPGCLVAALVQMGFAPEVIEQHAEAQTLYDWHGQARPQKAHIIIRRKNTGLGASNDVGFVKNADGKFDAVVSEYDHQKFNEGWLGRLKQGYAEVRTIAQAKLKGHRFLGRELVKNADGKETVKLRFAAR